MGKIIQEKKEMTNIIFSLIETIIGFFIIMHLYKKQEEYLDKIFVR